jgi:hypothetical protein
MDGAQYIYKDGRIRCQDVQGVVKMQSPNDCTNDLDKCQLKTRDQLN